MNAEVAEAKVISFRMEVSKSCDGTGEENDLFAHVFG